MLPAGSARRRALLQRRRDVGRIRFCAQDFWAERPSVIVICKQTGRKPFPTPSTCPSLRRSRLTIKAPWIPSAPPCLGDRTVRVGLSR